MNRFLSISALFLCGSTLLFAAEKPFAVDKSTAALWTLDGTTADEGPRNILLKHQTSKGGTVSWETADFGTALRFSGNERLIAREGSPVVALEHAISVEALIKIDPAALDQRMGIIQVMIYQESGFRLEVSNGRLIWMVEAPGKEIRLLSKGRVPAGEWVSVAATYDGNVMKIVINGVQDAERFIPGGVFSPNTRKVRIGYSDGQSEGYFRGSIAAIRITDGVRTSFHQAKQP